MTEKLFYEDSHMITFCANVEACEKVGDYYEVVLDRTAFFPEGGGQSADTGMLGNIKVLDVQEKGDIIYHVLEGPIAVGKEICGEIDWPQRFSDMQQHSGEHIVSGLIHATYGLNNVGFHMGKDAITMDFDGAITKEQLKQIEKKANEVVVQNLDIRVLYPTKEELQNMEYRSKIEIAGQVRVVEIPGYDRCACCAPHVKKTGEIGIIKLTGMQNYKGGVRVSMLCGFRALENYEEKAESVKQVSVLLSAKEREIAGEVLRIKEELSEKKREIAVLQRELLTYRVQAIPEGQPLTIVFETGLEGDSPREYVNLLLEKNIGIAAVFVGNSTDGYRYVIGSRKKDVRLYAKMIQEKFGGRGGGKAEMVQGTASGNEEAIREEMQRWAKEMYSSVS